MSKRATEFLPPVTYQGGKGRLAATIVQRMGLPVAGRFYDFCCGSGAVSVAAVERGQPPDQVTMVDLSPWGLFWQAIGNGTFDVARFEEICAGVPADPKLIKAHIVKLYSQPADEDTRTYVFLLLQAGSLGGGAIWLDGTRWRGGGFRDYWLPTETSSRRSHVNPMMPMPESIVERVRVLADRMRGVRGLCEDLGRPGISCCLPTPGSVAYIDPPYVGTSKYGYTIDVEKFASSLGIPCWVSEGRALTDNAVCLSEGRSKGGMTGNRKKVPNQEWLSMYGASP